VCYNHAVFVSSASDFPPHPEITVGRRSRAVTPKYHRLRNRPDKRHVAVDDDDDDDDAILNCLYTSSLFPFTRRRFSSTFATFSRNFALRIVREKISGTNVARENVVVFRMFSYRIFIIYKSDAHKLLCRAGAVGDGRRRCCRRSQSTCVSPPPDDYARCVPGASCRRPAHPARRRS